MKTLPATTPQVAKLCLSPVAVWQMLLTRLLEQHYSLTLNGTPFSNETVIKEYIDAGITLADAVNFLVDKFELVRIDRRGFSWQGQSPYLRAVDILRARQIAGLLREAVMTLHCDIASSITELHHYPETLTSLSGNADSEMKRAGRQFLT